MKKELILAFIGALAFGTLSAQSVKLDITSLLYEGERDSMILSMGLGMEVYDLHPKGAIKLTPVISDGQRKVLLPSIFFNGRQKHRLYKRQQMLNRRFGEAAPVSTAVYTVLGARKKNERLELPYRAAVLSEDWMKYARVSLLENYTDASGKESEIKETVLVEDKTASQDALSASAPFSSPLAAAPGEEAASVLANQTYNKYKGSYVSPDADVIDARNLKELNCTLDEARVLVNVSPQILSLRELYQVAMSYRGEPQKFYHIMSLCVKLFPTHPVANLNAAAAALELGDLPAVGKYLHMASRSTLAYKNNRGVYELMNGNVYEGIRLLKSAVEEGSEDALFNWKVFFESYR